MRGRALRKRFPMGMPCEVEKHIMQFTGNRYRCVGGDSVRSQLREKLSRKIF